MAIYVKKQREEILRQALKKLESSTQITSTSPGSVARAFTEAISTELGDMYDALDYNLAQTLLSTAKGRALDLIGDLYGVKRKTISDLAETDRRLGSFYFYLDTPWTQDINIPKGTRVFTSVESVVGRQFSYETTDSVILRAGRRRVYASLKPTFGDAGFSAGVDTLVQHNLSNPPGVRVKCTNPKAIAPQIGYENDSNYRIRLTKAIRVASSGTLEALRFSALAVSGVRDVKIRQTPYGLGSVEVLITPDESNSARTVMPEAIAKLNEVRPVGVRMWVSQPEYVAVDVYINLILKDVSDTRIRESIVSRARIGIMRYLNTLLSGDTLVYNRLIESVLNASDSIVDVQVTRYAPNGVEVIRKNYVPKENEQIIPGRIEINLI